MEDRGGGWGGSPRGRGGQWQQNSPRYRGNNNNRSFSPRYSSPRGGGQPHWQQSQSPYQFQPPFSTSTPIHHHPYQQQHSPRYRGRGGQQHRPFSPYQNSPRSHFNRSDDAGDIEKWVSPQMWEDPWKGLDKQEDYSRDDLSVFSKTQFAPLDESEISLSASNTSQLDQESDQNTASDLLISPNSSTTGAPSPINLTQDATDPPTNSEKVETIEKTDAAELNSPQELLNLLAS